MSFMLNIKTFEVNPLQENCYVVSDDTKECMIVDCGAFYPQEIQAITNYILENNLKPVVCALTHGHFDHIYGVRAICDRYAIKPIISQKDEELYKNFGDQIRMFMQADVDFTMPEIGGFVKDNDIVRFGNQEFRVIETPGHTRGGVFFYNEKEKVAFSGDTLFKGSIGRTDFPGGSMFQIIQSLRMVTQLPDDVKVYPGHGPQTTIGYELASNPYLDR